MTDLETLIKKAIEGGYKMKWMSGEDTLHFLLRRTNNPEIIFLNPLFFQSLGKACGWEKKTHDFSCYANQEGGKCDCIPEDTWEVNAILFYTTNLTSGLDPAIAYLVNLVKK